MMRRRRVEDAPVLVCVGQLELRATDAETFDVWWHPRSGSSKKSHVLMQIRMGCTVDGSATEGGYPCFDTIGSLPWRAPGISPRVVWAFARTCARLLQCTRDHWDADFWYPKANS